MGNNTIHAQRFIQVLEPPDLSPINYETGAPCLFAFVCLLVCLFVGSPAGQQTVRQHFTVTRQLTCCEDQTGDIRDVHNQSHLLDRTKASSLVKWAGTMTKSSMSQEEEFLLLPPPPDESLRRKPAASWVGEARALARRCCPSARDCCMETRRRRSEEEEPSNRLRNTEEAHEPAGRPGGRWRSCCRSWRRQSWESRSWTPRESL